MFPDNGKAKMRRGEGEKDGRAWVTGVEAEEVAGGAAAMWAPRGGDVCACHSCLIDFVFLCFRIWGFVPQITLFFFRKL